MFRIDLCHFFDTPARGGICLHSLDKEIFFVPSPEPVYLGQSTGFERLDEHSEYNEIFHLVLDCTAFDPDESHTHDTAWLALESHAREYCYELHRLRYAAVKEIRGS